MIFIVTPLPRITLLTAPKPAPVNKNCTVNVNKCGYVALSSTTFYPLSKLVSVNGISRSSINPILFTLSSKQKSPFSKRGMHLQSRHFSGNG
jgi:hypothetical protein